MNKFAATSLSTFLILAAGIWIWHQVATPDFMWLEAERVARLRDISMGGLITFVAYEYFGGPIAK
jgi:hypothetical protein